MSSFFIASKAQAEAILEEFERCCDCGSCGLNTAEGVEMQLPRGMRQRIPGKAPQRQRIKKRAPINLGALFVRLLFFDMLACGSG